MKLSALALLVLAFGAARGDDSPLGKVVVLLDTMKQKGINDMNTELQDDAAYKEWCELESEHKNADILEQNLKIDSLKASADENAMKAQLLQDEISLVRTKINRWTTELSTATDQRKTEQMAFDASDAEYNSSLQAFSNASAVLQAQDYDRKEVVKTAGAPATAGTPATAGAPAAWSAASPAAAPAAAPSRLPLEGGVEMFLQESSVAMPEKVFSALQYSDAPLRAAYEFQSGSVLDLVARLAEKFEKEYEAAKKQSSDKDFAFRLLEADLKSQISAGTHDVEVKTSHMQDFLTHEAQDKADLATTTTSRDADQKYQDDTRATCTVKAQEASERHILRKAELKAISQALQVLQKTLSGLHGSGTSFASLRASSSRPAEDSALAFISAEATRLDSKNLLTLTMHFAADPLASIKQMIQQMITKLTAEANDQADQKAWCQTETAANTQLRSEKTSVLDNYNAKTATYVAAINKNNNDISILQAELAEDEQDFKKASDMRAQEHETNIASIKDNQMGQNGLAQAVATLRDFYASQGGASLQDQDKAQEAADEAALAAVVITTTTTPNSTRNFLQLHRNKHRGPAVKIFSSNFATNLIKKLQQIGQDFGDQAAQTDRNEQMALKAFEAIQLNFKADTLIKKKQIDLLQLQITSTTERMEAVKDAMKGTQKELDAANAYKDTLVQRCTFNGTEYEERKAVRMQEANSLQNVLTFLNDNSTAA